jgi:hypothetical protein
VDANDPNTYDFNIPTEAIQVNNEIWISDQNADSVFVFDFNGNWLDTISGGMDNIRGLALFGNTVYVSNAGTGNGAPGDAIITIDASTRAVTGNFVVTDPSSLWKPAADYRHRGGYQRRGAGSGQP